MSLMETRHPGRKSAIVSLRLEAWLQGPLAVPAPPSPERVLRLPLEAPPQGRAAIAAGGNSAPRSGISSSGRSSPVPVERSPEPTRSLGVGRLPTSLGVLTPSQSVLFVGVAPKRHNPRKPVSQSHGSSPPTRRISRPKDPKTAGLPKANRGETASDHGGT